MLLVTTTFVRPSTDVEFFDNETFNAYRTATYVNTGKLAKVSDTISPDGLSRTIVNQWTLRANFAEFKQDPLTVQYFIEREAYTQGNGITTLHDYEYVPTDGDEPPQI